MRAGNKGRALGAAVIVGLLAVGGVVYAAAREGGVDPADVKISRQQAIDAATNTIRGEVVEVELENEDGVAVYEVTVRPARGGPHEVMVDASTGKVLGTEREDADEDADAGEDDRSNDG